jgi:hypothetical protein
VKVFLIVVCLFYAPVFFLAAQSLIRFALGKEKKQPQSLHPSDSLLAPRNSGDVDDS